jgi:hypothetical protein
MQIEKKKLSLTELPEKPAEIPSLTPRSLESCLSEGIDLRELVYRSLEEFADRQLSPRLIKLRYDYFEAKRKDLLAAATNARERILVSRKGSNLLSSCAPDPSTYMGSAASLEWGILKIEREKLTRFQEAEKRWLENCLNHELAALRGMEADEERITEETQDKSKKIIEESRRLKELNDRRRAIEEHKQRIIEAQQEVEKEKAKQAFAKHQDDIRKQQEREEQKKREAHDRSKREAKKRMKKENELRKQQDILWQQKQRALASIQEHDRERLQIIDKCKDILMKKLQARRLAKQERVLKSIARSRELERVRKDELVKKLVADHDRDERLAIFKQEQTEESAKKCLQLMLRRKIIQDESFKRAEEHREDMLRQHAELEKRLQEHENKKRRHIEFKQELESLKDKNKQLNVERQKKKEKYLREAYARKVMEKNSKIAKIFVERQQLWDTRKKTALESQKSREFVKRTIMQMRKKSKMNSASIETFVTRALNRIHTHVTSPIKRASHVDELFAEDTERNSEMHNPEVMDTETPLQDHSTPTGGEIAPERLLSSDTCQINSFAADQLSAAPAYSDSHYGRMYASNHQQSDGKDHRELLDPAPSDIMAEDEVFLLPWGMLSVEASSRPPGSPIHAQRFTQSTGELNYTV